MKKGLFRGGVYLIGLVFLACGLTLSTKVGLGVSPIISVPFSIATIWNLNFGNITLLSYLLFLAAEMILHVRLAKRNGSTELRKTLLMDALQLPFSLVFTRLINALSAQIPMFAEEYPGSFLGGLWGRILLMLVSVLFTGIGATMILDMRLVPNPADGIVQAIADTVGWRLGLTKNVFDLICACATTAIGLLSTGRLVGIGLGTVMSAVGVGRVIALFNHFLRGWLWERAGISPAESHEKSA